VWTTKRVLLLLGSFALLLTAYQAYAALLGGIDGLTPLPEEYWPAADGKPLPPLQPMTSLADRKLQQAFGEGCPELQRPVKLELRNRSTVLAVDDVKPDPESGRVKLDNFSIAMFGKATAAGAAPEINTVRSTVAFLRFDKPINNLMEMSSRKLLDAELDGDIQVSNNRRTPQRDDDLLLHTKGPMYYQEDQHRIWASMDVELTDFQSKPEPTRVTARGMDIYLTTETPGKPAAPQRKGKVESINGVERIELRSNVRMDLFVDSNSGFLASGKTVSKPAARPAQSPPEKAKVVITTAGPFSYDVTTDRARFEIPHRPSNYPENVEVKRLHEQGKLDQLFCDCLELQFRRKAAGSPQVPGDDRSVSLEIQSAHATGHQVTITSDSEGLDAFGNDLFYDALKRRTILKGVPEMVAMKEGSEIYAQELWLDSTEKRDSQEATAHGPGHIRMLDRTNGQRNLQASWTEQLLFKKEGGLDSLTLIGNAAFEDKEHHQRMRADRLRVWFEPADKTATPASTARQPRTSATGQERGPAEAGAPTSDTQQRLKPHHLEAKGHVVADSPEMRVKEPTENLDIWFKDAPPAELPAAVPDDGRVLSSAPAAHVAEKPDGGEAPASAPGRTITPGLLRTAPAQAPRPGAADKPKPPIDLVARSVVVHVLRTEAKNDLDELTCEGDVHVHQEPASPDDKGMDIRGETLQLNHHPDGGVLVVHGVLAHVQMDKMAILGPEVNIDQRANKAWVNGLGAMQMLTDTNLDGAKLTQPTELTIHWKDGMLFTGKSAEFRGGVQAEQDASRLLCQEMQVTFDRPISLKESDKGRPQARVDKLLCDKDVQMEEINEVAGRLRGYKRLVAPLVDLDNDDGTATAPGPGEVRILQLGEADDIMAKPQPARGTAPRPATATGAKQELKLTHVRFNERMQANNKTRTAIFYGNVEAVNVPADRPDVKIDLDSPPPGCMYLHCEKLKVYSKPLANNGKSQELEAYKKVTVRAQEFYGFADVVKYDESQDRVIFEAGEGGMATLYRVKVTGGQEEKLSGKKIYYWRRTNEFKIENAYGINVAN
jgi:hypothetical protein